MRSRYGSSDGCSSDRNAASAPWIAARDTAVLLLLYGSGLRISEALSLTGAALPLGEVLTVTGKRAKTRLVPLLEPVRAAMEDYVRQSPWPVTRDRKSTSLNSSH